MVISITEAHGQPCYHKAVARACGGERVRANGRYGDGVVSVLRVYVDKSCPTCARARQLAAAAQRSHPDLKVELVNLSEPGTHVPAEVFAVPTFVLDGQVISLGTPRPSALLDHLTAHLARAERHESA
jgi:hypothetical protein